MRLAFEVIPKKEQAIYAPRRFPYTRIAATTYAISFAASLAIRRVSSSNVPSCAKLSNLVLHSAHLSGEKPYPCFSAS